jgi:predicted hydrocarbon binding protein
MRPHFAAVRAIDTSGYVPSAPPTAPEAAPPIPAGPGKMAPSVPRATPSTGYDSAPPPAAPPPAAPTVELAAEPLVATRSATVERIEIPDEFLLPTPPPPPAPAPPPADPFVEIAALPADEATIARLLDGATVSAALVEQLRALEDAVAPGAREPTLHAAGLRLGRAMAPADAAAAPLTVADAVAQAGLPALRGMVDVVLQGEQLHIRQSPLCDRPGHSGCAFFGGLLQGALVPRVAAHEISVFNVCCRAWGADECVLAIAD